MVDTFTPEQIAQILEEFFKVVGTRRYVGERYVPIFGRKGEESIEWDNSAPYEPLTIVLYQGNSYTSRQYVPIGVDITNQEFWVITGNYNAQTESAITAANNAQNDIDTLLPKVDFSAENTVKKYIDENPTRILTFDTVADMQAATDLIAGMTCHTNGFHASGDGGAAYYTVSTSGTANGMDVLALQGGLFAMLVVTEPYVTPEMFGAWGDGTKDDTDVIQHIINLGRDITLLPKKYMVSDLRMTSYTNIVGHGWDSVLEYTGTDTAITIKSAADVKLDNLALRCAAYVSGGSSISAASYVGIKIEHLKSVDTINTWSNVITNCLITGFETAFYYPATVNQTNDYCSETYVANCKVFQNKCGVLCNNNQALNNTFYSVHFERNNLGAAANDTTTLLQINNGGFNFIGCSLIGAGSVFDCVYNSTYSLPRIFANFTDCRIEKHPSQSDTYLFNNAMDTDKDALLYLSVSNLLVYAFKSDTDIYIARSTCRGSMKFDSVRVSRSGSVNLYPVKVISVVGKTGRYGTPYSFVSMRNASWLTSPKSDFIEGALTYCGVIDVRDCIDENTNPVVIAAHQTTERPQGITSTVFRIGSNETGAQFSNRLFQLPLYAQINKIAGYWFAPTAYSACTLNVYRVKNKANWEDPDATEPSAADMTLIATISKGANVQGKVEATLQQNNSSLNLYFVSNTDGYDDGLYYVEKASGSMTGFVEIEFY